MWTPDRMWMLDRLLRQVVREGELEVRDHRGVVRRYGAPGARSVGIALADAATAGAIGRDPALGAGEAWMDGRLTMTRGSIADLIDLFAYNLRWDRDHRPRRRLAGSAKLAARWDQLNWRRRARRNVAHHYDLSDRLYDLFLDADRQYSCAYFREPDASLEQAQADKKAHIAAKLDLKPGMRVLDIGCGWGGMALYLNRHFGVDVMGVTLSEEQLRVARARAEEAGVADRVRFELVDYRDVAGPFDRIVSVGMFEHVGLPNYGEYFDKVGELLTADGVALIHTIGRVGGPGATDGFTAKYIFPGGYAPALSQIVPAIEAAWLWPTDIETWRLHYAKTLQCWLDRVEAKRAEIEALYDARFWRMWVWYLAASRAAFEHDDHVVFQIQLAKKRDTLPLTRDYMAVAEERLHGTL
jgi:cyclopropane-fatty-acyl-phospholipid synthase